MAAQPLQQRIAGIRALRAQLEDGVEPLALSVDGHSFTLQAPLRGERLPVGGYVRIDAGGEPLLGQILVRAVAERTGPEIGLAVGVQELGLGAADGTTVQVGQRIMTRHVAGEGVLLGALGAEGFHHVEAAPFADAPFGVATPEEVGRYLTAAAGGLAVGPALAGPPDVPVRLQAKGFSRHTFLCGQSGSGKTYSLGVMLEQLLLETSLRIIVLDPNSDYIALGDLDDRAREDPRAHRYRQVADRVQVLRPVTAGSPHVLQLRMGDLSPDAQAEVMGLDPLVDREEYAAFRATVEAIAAGATAQELLAGLSEPLRLRLRNLGIMEWEVWRAERRGPLLDDMLDDESWRCLVLDLGSLSTPDQQWVVTERLLERLWHDRAARRPTLIVIDEAHNICPAEPEDGLQAMITARCVQIAGEGRKYGLYLFLATQRPVKLHPNVLSQCENLILMRMNSRGDLAHVQEVFSMVPAGLLGEATTFGLGGCLLAGRIIDSPTLARSGARLSREGGGDVPATWAAPPDDRLAAGTESDSGDRTGDVVAGF